MTYFPIPTGTDDRAKKSLVPIRMRNVMITPLAGGSQRGRGFAAVPRPGYVARATPEAGKNIRGLFSQKGFHDSVLYAVAGTQLRSIDTAWASTNCGAISGTDTVLMDALITSLMLVGDGNVFEFDATTLTASTDEHTPDPAATLCIFGSRAVVSQLNTDINSWSAVADGLNWPALAFASSEARADPVVNNVVNGTIMVSFGAITAQVFNAIGGPDESAIQVDPTYQFDIGLLSRDALSSIYGSILFISQDKEGNIIPVMMVGLQPRRIVNHGLVARLQALTTAQRAQVRTFVVGWLDKKLWVVCVPDGKPAMTYDVSTDTWAEWTSFGEETFALGYATPFNDKIVVAGPESDTLYTLEENAYTDDGEPIECVVAFHVPVAGPVSIDNITLDIKCHGQEPGEEYKARLRYYGDGGSLDSVTVWADEREIDLPALGDYGIPQPETRFGLARAPNGILIEVTITDPLGWALYGIWVNELPE